MIQKLLNWKTILLLTVAILAVLSSLQVLQAPDAILDDVIVQEEGGMYVLQVKTNVPVRYENHYPQGPSRFVQIKVRTVSLVGSDMNEYMGAESILPGFIEQVPVMDVAYEGGVPGGPFLSIRFKEPVRYQVKEDPDLNGVFLYIPKKSRL